MLIKPRLDVLYGHIRNLFCLKLELDRQAALILLGNAAGLPYVNPPMDYSRRRRLQPARVG
jgi:hypothetical protein